MTYSGGPFITENFGQGESYRDSIKDAPPEMVIEQLIRKNPEALSAMFDQLGITEEEFAKRVEDSIKKESEKDEDRE